MEKQTTEYNRASQIWDHNRNHSSPAVRAGHALDILETDSRMAMGGILCFDRLGAHCTRHIKDCLQNLDAHRTCARLGQHKDRPRNSLLSCLHSDGDINEDVPQRPDAPEHGRQSRELSLRQRKTTKRTDGKDILMIDLLKDLWGFIKLRKKILACTNYYCSGFAGSADSIFAGLGGCAVYLYVVFRGMRKKSMITLKKVLFELPSRNSYISYEQVFVMSLI